MPQRTSALVLGRRRRKNIGRPRTPGSFTAVAVLVAAAQFGNAEPATDVAGAAGPRLTTVVSIDGAIGRWTPAHTATAVPAAPVATTDPATAPPVPTRSVVPTTPAPPGTITPTATVTSPLGEVTSPNQPQPRSFTAPPAPFQSMPGE